VNRRLFEVLQMLKPASSFFAPHILRRVAAHALRSRLGGDRRPKPIPAIPDAEIVAPV
jgi:hypothetical protein